RAGHPRGAGAVLGHPAPPRPARAGSGVRPAHCGNAGRHHHLNPAGQGAALTRNNMPALPRLAPLAALLTLAPPAQAADFYQGKQITLTVGFTAGGMYDVSGRLWARFLTKHLAGHPTVVVRNMPGSGSLVAALHTYTA